MDAILQCAVRDIFGHLAASAAANGPGDGGAASANGAAAQPAPVVTVSVIEVYNEDVRDLVSGRENLTVAMTAAGIQLPGAEEASGLSSSCEATRMIASRVA